MKNRSLLQLVLLVVFLGSGYCQKYRKCVNGSSVGPLPKTAKETTVILGQLRGLFSKYKIDAYIIPSVDEHQSEYVASQAMRQKYVSGFSGSAGTAIVTKDKAALWTDGRYFEQGEMQLDCNWILQKDGQPGVPKDRAWLKQELKNKQVVGIDPRLITISSWKSLKTDLAKSGIVLKAVMKNLVDEIWKSRPIPTKTSITVLSTKYSGETWQSKVKRLRQKMKAKKTSVMVLSALDDVAWLLCLRGADIPYNPFFFGYILVTQTDVRLFVDKTQLTEKVKKHVCPNKSNTSYCVQIYDYDQLADNLNKTMKNPPEKLWLSPRASYLLKWGINESQIMQDYLPVKLMKAVKNSVEIKGMKDANTKDGVAISEFFVWLEKEIGKGVKTITEISAAKKLREFKSKQADFKDLSFSTISAFGPNGAIIHYSPSNLTDLAITDKGLYLVDCGCQFPEGTTDITRTVHFGTPTAFEKEAYTRVLKGSIQLAMVVFPRGVYGRHIDMLARSSLWKSGLDYNHGTGHGIGHFLSVHEGPQAIGGGKVYPSEKPLEAGMVQSIEPGYYETGKFGIRLETAVLTINATTKYRFEKKMFLAFEAISLVPFQLNLIDADLLTAAEVKWLDDFNTKSRKILGEEIKRQGKMEVHEWLMKNTAPIRQFQTSSTISTHLSSLAVVFAFAQLVIMF